MTKHDGPRNSRKAMDPQRLQKLMDMPIPANAAREVPKAIIKNSTLAPSWNGERCDVRPFGKLEEAANTLLKEDQRSVRIQEQYPSALQLNDVRVRPLHEDLSKTITAPVLVQHEGFARAPEMEYLPVPSSVLLQEGIMNPTQRRERLKFETDYHLARGALHRADMNDRRLHQIIKARHFTSDVLGTDSSGIEARSSRIRGEPYQSELLSHDQSRRADHREFQSKDGRANPLLHTHDRVFNETPVSWNRDRAQHLRNEGNAGRSYNIVNGGCVQYFPPTIAEKEHTRQSHPSVIVHPYTR